MEKNEARKIINDLQNSFQNKVSFFLEVKEAQSGRVIAKKVDNIALGQKHQGSVEQLFTWLKMQGYERVIIQPRRQNGSVSVKMGNPIELKLEKMPMEKQPLANNNGNSIATAPISADMSGLNAGVNMAKAAIYKEQLDQEKRKSDRLENKIEQLTSERDQLKTEKLELTKDREILSEKLKKAKKKSKQPKGLAGLSADHTALILQQAPAIIKALGLNVNGQQQGSTAGEIPQGQSEGHKSELHKKVSDSIQNWPPELLAELLHIIDKYNTGDDPEFIDVVRGYLNPSNQNNTEHNG